MLFISFGLLENIDFPNFLRQIHYRMVRNSLQKGLWQGTAYKLAQNSLQIGSKLIADWLMIIRDG
jgi:hypothetical protein